MARMSLSLSNLKEFDFGRADVAFKLALEEVVRDILDRPGMNEVRKVRLEMQIKPIMQQTGDVVDAEVAFMITNAIPAWKTASRPLIVDRQGRLIFQADAPDNPRQSTFMPGDPAPDEEAGQ